MKNSIINKTALCGLTRILAATTGALLVCAAPAARASLLTYYTFEGNGNDSAGSRNLLLVNTTFSTNTPSGTGFSLAVNGSTSDANYDVLGGDSLSGSFTVQAYVNLNSTAPGGFFGTRQPGELSFDGTLANGNLIHGDIGDGTNWLSTSADATFTYNLNQWYNIAYVVTPSGYTIYADGNQVGQDTYSGTPLLFDANHDFAVGNSGIGMGGRLDGLIDDVRIYDTALTQAQVQANIAPEPTSAALLLGSGAMLLAARRRRSAQA